MGDTEQNLDAVLLVLVILQVGSDAIHLVLGEPVLVVLQDKCELVLLVYFSFLKKLEPRWTVIRHMSGCRFMFLKKIKRSYETLGKVKTPLFLDHKGPK